MKFGNQQSVNPLFIGEYFKRLGENENFINGEQEDTYEFFQRIRDTIETSFLCIDKYKEKKLPMMEGSHGNLNVKENWM